MTILYAWAKIASTVRSFFPIFVLACCVARAQAPVHVDFQCTGDDIDYFGLACTEEVPCPVYLELSSLVSAGMRLFITGNFHTAEVTLYSILLMSPDEGKTWTEPYPRIRSASLGDILFVNLEKGWASGETVQSLPRNPFFLITADGGKTWQQQPVFEEDRVGTIAQFWFDSPNSGSVVIQSGSKNELYETMTGGSTWSVRQVTDNPIRLKQSVEPSPGWRLRADAATKTYRVEKQEGAQWRRFASFPIHVSDCKPGEAAPPPPPTQAAPPQTDAPPPEAPRAPRKPPSLKKPGDSP
ncbi:MAG: WD40/YVTN/BNR-like repeat-containing protein [Bryobacteraceae bacterium]